MSDDQKCSNMDRFILFAGYNYYPYHTDNPYGGVDDMVGFFPTVEAARARFEAPDEDGDYYEWGQVVDRETMQIVERLY